jgi:hypothetical protein
MTSVGLGHCSKTNLVSSSLPFSIGVLPVCIKKNQRPPSSVNSNAYLAICVQLYSSLSQFCPGGDVLNYDATGVTGVKMTWVGWPGVSIPDKEEQTIVMNKLMTLVG